MMLGMVFSVLTLVSGWWESENENREAAEDEFHNSHIHTYMQAYVCTSVPPHAVGIALTCRPVRIGFSFRLAHSPPRYDAIV